MYLAIKSVFEEPGFLKVILAFSAVDPFPKKMITTDAIWMIMHQSIQQFSLLCIALRLMSSNV